MNKRQIFIQILKAAVLISVVLAMLPVYVHASYDLGSFSGTFVPIYDKDGRLVDVTPKEFWHTLTITHSGKLVLNFTYTGSTYFDGTNVSLWKPDKSGLITGGAIRNNSITSDHLAPGIYYIRVFMASSSYGTYTIQAVLTPDVSATGLQDEIVCLRILSGIPVSSSEIIITDISNDGRIGMEECVYILQVVAGLRP